MIASVIVMYCAMNEYVCCSLPGSSAQVAAISA